MSKVRKFINGIHTASTFCVASMGVLGTATLGAIFNVANKGFNCLPSPPVDARVIFDATNFNYLQFISEVTAHDANISLPIHADLAFAGAGSCATEVAKTALLISVPIITTYAAISVAKGISDCSKDSPEAYHKLDVESGEESFELTERRRCC
tara:strand:+ start:8197 stop:8655 length:459 start_codon:yes stop_codon:yes gene_type:complete